MRIGRLGLYFGRLGGHPWIWQAAYRKDVIARHWWVDAGRYRVAVIVSNE